MAFVVKLIPPDVLAHCHQLVDAGQQSRPGRASLIGAAMVIAAWLIVVALVAAAIWRPRTAE